MTKRNPFEDTPADDNPENVMDALYGVTPTTNKKLRIPYINIDHIYPDDTQPRTVLPAEIRPLWSGNPMDMPNLIQNWLESIYDSGYDFDPVAIITGKAELGERLNTGDALVDKFTSILLLASQIHDSGLLNPITVYQIAKDIYEINHGERRWTAHHFLAHFIGETYHRIAAQVTEGSAWELAKTQAQENVREDLNAIGKAAQFAKLLMAARAETQDPPYDSFQHSVVKHGSKRPYYAQVADGDKHRIPRGMGPEFEQALGISTAQMRHYRNLLRLTGDFHVDNMLWELGADNDWAEGFMRDIGKELEVEVIQRILDTVTIVTVSDMESTFREAITTVQNARKLAKSQANRQPSPPVSPQPTTPETPLPVLRGGAGGGGLKQGDWATLPNNKIVRITAITDIGYKVSRNGTNLGEFQPISLRPLVGQTIYVRDDAFTIEAVQNNGMINTVHLESGVGHTFTQDAISFTPPATGGPITGKSHLVSDGSPPASTINPDENPYIAGIDPGYGDHTVTIIASSDGTIIPAEDEAPLPVSRGGAGGGGTTSPDNTVSQHLKFAHLLNQIALLDDKPVFVLHEKKGQPDNLVVQDDNERITVHYSRLKPHPTLGGSPSPQRGTAERMGRDLGRGSNTISSLDSLPSKSDKIITGNDQRLIKDLILDMTTRQIKCDGLLYIANMKPSEVDDELPDFLEVAMREVEAYTQYLRTQTKTIFHNLAVTYRSQEDES